MELSLSLHSRYDAGEDIYLWGDFFWNYHFWFDDTIWASRYKQKLIQMGRKHIYIKKERWVIQFTKYGVEIARHPSCSAAARNVWADASGIAACARWVYATMKGFIWEFIPDDQLSPSKVYAFKDRSGHSPWKRDNSKKTPPRIIQPENNT